MLHCVTNIELLFNRGYMGPGGIGDGGDHAACTGGIHRYVDIMLFTDDLIYHAPTCKELYSCQCVSATYLVSSNIPLISFALVHFYRSYDPEGFLGTLTASFLTYLGLMSGLFLQNAIISVRCS